MGGRLHRLKVLSSTAPTIPPSHGVQQRRRQDSRLDWSATANQV